ncbi:MAG TPA: prolyl oligopeptidase family serine peptidase, partial [Polyangiaceae bacterium]|nr:prolyl oligopeptidase family serine peptidase [Polyangiaceae bacterium]
MSFRPSLGCVSLAASLACSSPAGVAATGVATAPGQSAAGGAVGAAAETVGARQGPEAILERADLAAYHGWIRYLMFRAGHAEERFGKGSEGARQDQEQLASWTQRILDNPALLGSLRGVVEWAYLSPVDGSGQPFRLNIPTDYDPARPAPLSLYMHGMAGNHIEHAAFMQDKTGGFEVSVLGRSRGGRYRALSEADVLAVLDYVEAHWAIDSARVHLMGGSMGGAGTYWMAARYPQRFATGRPVCGNASELPLGNLLHFPVYATHSDDDFQVPVLHSRGPLAKLKELGADVTYDETTGYGHAVWNYKEGNDRANAWFVPKTRPASNTLKKLDYTALDGRAMRDYWAEIVEWGPKPEPASFALDVSGKNQVALRVNNVSRLALRVREAPLDPDAPLVLAIGGARLTRPAPLPNVVTLARHGNGWVIEDQAPELPFRLHTPGGANQLYDGEPLLIVYGTSGSDEVDQALRDAAAVASHSFNASWQSPNGDVGNDGISHNQNLYGELNIAADVDVTPEQIATRHLVLIGTAAENTLVARMADRLPLRYEGDAVRFNDGSEEPAADSTLGLVSYNPLAPSRLIFWVASNARAGYRADAIVPRVLGSSVPTGIDFALSRAVEPTLLMARSFDSRWSWVSREASPALPTAATEVGAFSRGLAESVRRAAKADFALALALPNGPNAAIAYASSLRLADLTAMLYYEPIAVMTLTGAELEAARRALPAGGRLQPEPAKLAPERSYRVALTARQISPLVAATHL